MKKVLKRKRSRKPFKKIDSINKKILTATTDTSYSAAVDFDEIFRKAERNRWIASTILSILIGMLIGAIIVSYK